MDKMRMESVDMTAQNIEKIEDLFPNCITETIDADGKPRKAINSNSPIRKTLRSCPDESVEWENTENLYIEGDNLEVMKLLQESYLGAVKMIYGSATTAHGVFLSNLQDGGNRTFIMVQLPEACDENTSAYQQGYTTICDIGKERIRRAGTEIQNSADEGMLLDIGFRVLKLDDTNMRDVYYSADDYNQDMLAMLESNCTGHQSEGDLRRCADE